MALLDSDHNRPRDALPSINHFDIDKLKTDRSETSRYSIMSGLSVQTGPVDNMNAQYSGPPPPYSCASAPTSMLNGAGYVSPPDSSTTRRSYRDEKESPSVLKSLPSIHEALGEKTMMSTPAATTQSHTTSSAPTTATGHSFPDAPSGPPNPFSQSVAHVLNSNEPSLSHPIAEKVAIDNAPLQTSIPHSNLLNDVRTDAKPRVSQPYQYPASPHTSLSTETREPHSRYTSLGGQHDPILVNSPYQNDQPRPPYPGTDYHSQASQTLATTPRTSTSFHFESNVKFDEHNNPFLRPTAPANYGETVKRHLDVYDAEIALNEIHEGSSRTIDFSQYWSHRYHQSNRTNSFAEGVPSLQEVDEMLRQSQRVMENLSRIRELVVMQQAALSEERARAARGTHLPDDYNGLHDDYKTGGFAGGDAKKRRGKAAPPGRCHSCNRAETPEWRRGPDGARTLCNACGLHYAKLTRKMGANKATALTGSSLRPKTLDPRP